MRLTPSTATLGWGRRGGVTAMSVTATKATHKVALAIINVTLFSGWETVNTYFLVLEIGLNIEV